MLVLEWHEEDGVDWWLSFTNHNPKDDECILCPSKEFAFTIKALIEKYCSMRSDPNPSSQTNLDAK